MSNQKGILTLVGIIIIVAIAIIAFGGVFAYQYFAKSQTPTTKSQVNSNVQNSNPETAGWKTYTNTDYGFSFQYPSNLNFKEYAQAKWWNNIEFYEKNKVFLSIDVIETNNLNKVNLDTQGNSWSPTGKEVIVGGIKGEVVETFPSNDCYNIVVKNNSFTYLLGDGCLHDVFLFNQMLSTFKFTK